MFTDIASNATEQEQRSHKWLQQNESKKNSPRQKSISTILLPQCKNDSASTIKYKDSRIHESFRGDDREATKR